MNKYLFEKGHYNMTDHHEIIAKLALYFDFDEAIDENKIKTYIFDGLRDIKLPASTNILRANLEVKNYIALLPKDFHYIENIYTSENQEFDTYSIRGSRLKVPFKSGSVYIEYLGYPIEADTGDIIIPSFSDLEFALTWWVVSILMLTGYRPKDPNLTRREAELKYSAYKNAAQNNLLFSDYSSAWKQLQTNFDSLRSKVYYDN